MTMSICMVTGIPQTYADFDPVNDDTDIFLANPSIISNRPNVLLYIDNTANWNTAFANEKTALVNVVQNLSDGFNVGLITYPETGGGNDNIDGATLRFAVRQMVGDNKTTLASLVNGWNVNTDKGNNSTLSEGMVEIFRYFNGATSYSSFGKEKTDYTNNTSADPGNNFNHEATAAGLSDYALEATPNSSSVFNSPIADACQKNFVIYLSNGPANENSSSLSNAEAELAAQGYDTSSTISLSRSGAEGSWADEWAQYMNNADVNSATGTQNVTFYTVEVDPGTQNSDLDMTALMKSVALHGGGEYFETSSANGGQAILNALNTIFTEIQAVNSVFASTTLPVSVNVRGTNLNQVYIGVFRPDENKDPRWFGNLKMYKLGFDSDTSTLFLADAAGTPAENPATGFINASSASFWTANSSFWGYRTAEENGTGGNSDSPDGDLVEKGGAAQKIRDAYPTNPSASSNRTLYTCTGSCATGSSLSSTPFETTNSDISNASLGLGTTAISSLTGFVEQPVTAITDVFDITAATTAAGGVAVTSIDSAAVGQTTASLTSINTQAITALNNSPVVQTFTNLNRASGNPKDPVIATVNGHGYSDNQTVFIAGVVSGTAGYNGQKTIDVTGANTFKYSTGTSNPSPNPDYSSGTISTTTTIVTATVANHGLNTSDSVTITGVVPSAFNGTYNINKINDDTFTFVTSSALAPVTDVSSATVSARSTVATATAASHGFSVSDSIIVSGATVSGYNGTYTVTRATTNLFSFVIPVSQADDNSGTAVVYAGTSVATATAPSHGFADGALVSISGANPSTLNGTYNITFVDGNTFSYTTISSADDTDGGIMASDGTSNQATVTIPGHPFSVGDFITVTGVTPGDYNVSNEMVDTVIDGNTITYTVTNTPSPASDVSSAAAKFNSATAVVTLPTHGYSTANQITIEGATPTEYNKSDVSITVIDTDTFKYSISSSQDADATGTITAKIKTTTAQARAVDHGFSTSDVVQIAGVSPSAFNGSTFSITRVDDDNFTYTIPSAQGDGTGTMTASSGSGSSSARSTLINWVRGDDNQEDENANASTTDVRASIHGDVLHSRPAVVNYNRHGNDDDVYVYYGSNDGVLRAVKGGFDQSDAATTAAEPLPGQEAWGFIPEEFFSKFQRLRNNEPNIGSNNKKPYFMDGTIGVLVEDNSGPGGEFVPDDLIDVTVDDNNNPDKVHLFISMRRGGRFIYALDVSAPADPKLLWKKSSSDAGFGELGYTWSAPNVFRAAANSGDPMIIFGAGYDPDVEDIDPAEIDARTATTVTHTGGAVETRTMGRGIFVVDADDGDIIWQAGPSSVTPVGSHPYVVVDGMDYAIPSDVVVISNRVGSVDNRAYVGDTGGNMWRIDMDDVDPDEWKVTKLASIADESGLADADPDPSGLRKFLFPPDVVYSDDGYDAVLVGSGDREHPFDETVVNRFYMFKDVGTDADTPLIDTTVDDDGGITVQITNDSTLSESDLFDATSNCIQSGADCSGSGDEADSTTAASALASANGWFITLGTGEKVVGNSVTLNNITFFNTNQPETAVVSTDCSSNLGVARQYKVSFDDATAFEDQNIDGSTDAADRYTTHVGGGYLPSPVPVVVEIDGEIHEGVISGVAVDQPPGSELNARLRKFWYKEMD